MEALFSLVVVAMPFAILGILLAVIIAASRMNAPTRDKIVYAASRIGALGLGLLWGFFVAFNVVFSDIFGLGEHLGALLYVVVAYLVLGFAFGAAGPKTSWRWGWWLAAPGVVNVSGVVLAELGAITWFAAYGLGVIACVIAGTLGGIGAGVAARRWLAARRATASH